MAMAAVNIDSRGILRGRCSSCVCDGYKGGSEKKKCIRCGHPPGKHMNFSTNSSVTSCSLGVSSISALSSPASAFNDSRTSFIIPFDYQCRYPGCQKDTDFDPNTGAQKAQYCQEHILYTRSSQTSCDAFPAPEWSLTNTDSSDIATSQSDSSDSEQEWKNEAKPAVGVLSTLLKGPWLLTCKCFHQFLPMEGIK